MATVDLYLDTRRALKDGTYPLKLRVSHERKTKYFKTDPSYSFSLKGYEKIIKTKKGSRLDENQAEIRDIVFAQLSKASSIIKELEFFNFAAFQLRFTGKGDRNDILFRLEELCDSGNNPGSTGVNKDAYSALTHYINRDNPKFIPGKKGKGKNQKSDIISKLPMNAITPKWLNEFEAWQIKRGLSPTTIAIILNRVKAVFNQAIRDQEIDPNRYPFGKGKYQPPAPRKSKKYLKDDQLVEFFKYEAKTSPEEFAKDFFIFSYLASGMNLGDIFLLKWSNFNGRDSFSFFRRKTVSRSTDPKEITVHLNEHLWAIIDKHGSRKINNDYVFNIVDPSMDTERAYVVIKMAINKVNVNLKKIGESLGFDVPLTSYHARHAYATKLMKVAPVAYISKQLGHSNIQTTEDYLGQFEKDEALKYEANLIPKIN
ncbi:site-specific integrase [Echinicola marina]|uniref:site-specific integrase n=1 Tax=Echinicola marina TaxID=2859768 RepID=UPI001CF6501C|nr:site-specific integrase [Echinicola marina]UCS94839.1 site-specific integrase [Echinicola marina]